MNTFDEQREGTGTHEWAEVTENISRGCPHDCLYCYAAQNAKRFKLRDRADWKREELTKRAYITSYPARDGVIMFPSAHDVVSTNVEAYIRVARLMLEKGNRLLVVSKPHFDCVAKMCDAFEPFTEQILFRFTIGTTDAAVAKHWEPGAPLPIERIEALAYARRRGFRTSVSAEPLLGGLEAAKAILAAVRSHVSDTVWIGKMNKIRTRVDMSDPANAREVALIEAAQTDEEVLRMFEALREDPIVRWKDSVGEVVARSVKIST